MLDTNHQVEVPEGLEINLPVAGPVPRALAFMLDMLIRIGIYMLLSFVLGIMGHFGRGILYVFVFLLEWFYPVLFEVLMQGATPGKKMMGLAVVHDDGTPVSWSASLVRNLLRTADMFPLLYLTGLLSMMLNKQFKRLGDLAAGTLVIHKKSYSHRGKLKVCPAKQSPVALTLDEQSAILHFGERSQQLSKARNHELVSLLDHLVDGNSDEQKTEKLLGIANWLRGHR